MKIVDYFFNDVNNIKIFDSNLLKIDKIDIINKKLHKNIDIYNIKYITIKDIDYGNPLYLIFNKVDGYIDKSNWNKYLTFASTDKDKEVLTKYTELLKYD